MRHVGWISAGVLALVTVTVFVVVLDNAPDQPALFGLKPEAVSSSTRHEFTDLGELIDASDLIVDGEVVATERGRVFGGIDDEGKAAETAVRSRVLTLRVDEVIATGAALAADGTEVVLVEEEGWLTDGTPLVVDAAHASGVGDTGIWFLVATRDADFPGFVVVNSQGRYLRKGGGLRGADRTDALVRQLEALGPDGLADEIRRVRVGAT